MTYSSQIPQSAVPAAQDAQAPTSLAGDLLKGVRQISDFLGLPDRQVFHLCSTGQLRGAFKMGRLWYARKSALMANLSKMEEPAQ